MTNEQLLLGFVEQALGKGKRTSGNNYAFYCPICSHRKPKLELDFDTEYFHCWTCQPVTKGRGMVSLFNKLHLPKDILKDVKRYSKFKSNDRSQENTEKLPDIKLPPEYKPLYEAGLGINAMHVIAYLEGRGVTKEDILKYKIGYCENGRYFNSVIIPSYNKDGGINYFVSRTIDKDSDRKYNAPKTNKSDIIAFENLINWNVPVILCEGLFDAIAIKRNAVPLLGKSLPQSLLIKLAQPEVSTIYVALDSDALRDALDHCQKLLNMGKEVYLIELEEKDPSDIGFEGMIKLLQSAKPLGTYDILKKKISLA